MGRTYEQMSVWTGLIASLAVSLPVAGAWLVGDPVITGMPAVVWWGAYTSHLIAFWSMSRERRPVGLTDRRLLAVQLVAAALVVAAAPAFGWTAVLMVINAVSAAFVLPARQAGLVVAAQSALLCAAALAANMPAFDIVLSVAVYTGFQGFALLASLSERRQQESAEEVAAINAELRAAMTLLGQSSRTAERLRIARELHDLVGHQLTALALELEVAARRAVPPAADHVERARRIAKELLGDVRSAVGDLRAPTPGLRTALETIAEGFSAPVVHVAVDDDLALDDETATALVRCAQEAITNALRHAQADNLWLDVTSTDEAVVLSARDDGCGATDLRPGNGLRGMRERLEALGGDLFVETGSGGGLRLTARLPVPTGSVTT